MNILIAPNAFKNSLSAEEAATAIQQGLKESLLQCTTTCFPIADGGDGTGDLLVKKCQGRFVNIPVSDPIGRKIKAAYGLIDDDKTAVIEMANASGLRLLSLQELAPLKTSSYGTGEMIVDALNRSVKKIILTMGGSATVDGGMGILRALGIKFINKHHKILVTAEELVHLERIDSSALDKRILKCEVIILCDVNNPLLGENGASNVFGPQKGATVGDIKKLEASLSRMRDVVFADCKKDMNAVSYSGTAGGAAAGIHAMLDARLVNGIEEFLKLTSFDDFLKDADLLITGEGSIDEQTLSGKGPYGVALKAKLKDIPVIAVAGKVPVEKTETLAKIFPVLIPIGNEPMGMPAAIGSTKANLIRTATLIGNFLSLK